uniref:Uncharacterized protein n=1 Tax=Lepeophtheirus salmonis TaxID=72036 RepID=A0A0K2TSQ9_LEPSM
MLQNADIRYVKNLRKCLGIPIKMLDFDRLNGENQFDVIIYNVDKFLIFHQL